MTTAADAARVLVELAGVEGIDNPTTPRLPGDPAELDPWEALTRDPKRDALLARYGARRDAAAAEGIDRAAPSIVVTMPSVFLQGWGNRGIATALGDPDPETLAADGFPGWVWQVASNPAEPRHRPRLAVVGKPENLTPTPRNSRALALAVLGARRAAGALDRWRWPNRRAERLARVEASTYRELADRYEGLLGASLAWTEHVEVKPPVVGTPTRPVTLRGH